MHLSDICACSCLGSEERHPGWCQSKSSANNDSQIPLCPVYFNRIFQPALLPSLCIAHKIPIPIPSFNAAILIKLLMLYCVTLQVKITVLEDNDPFAQYRYLVTVFTGHRRGAATTSKVPMALCRESSCTHLENWRHKGVSKQEST